MNGRDDIDAKLFANDQALGLPPGTTRAQFMVESGMRGDAISPAGARGWAQVMPATQATLERRAGRKFDPSNLDDAIEMHRAVMGENLTKFGNLPDALRAYNGGWNREKWGNRETSAYPYKVLGQIDGQAINDTRPPTMAERYKKGGLMPASYSDDSDIFADMPRKGAKASAAPSQSMAVEPEGGDADIFADLPEPQKKAAPTSKRADPTALERGMAIPAGVNKGLTMLGGLPVDTAANILDLAKAGVGFAYNEGKKLVTGKPSAAPAWTEPFDRSQVVGSSEWIGKNINRAAAAGGVRSPIDNPRPDDALSRVLYSGGVVGGASVNPNPQARMSGARQLFNATGGFVSGLASGGVGEVSPEWAPVAGMAPAVAARVGAAGMRGAVRGGEAGRRLMEQRIQDLKNGGVEDPSLGLASGRRTIMGLENILSQTPGSVGMYERAGERNMAGMRGKTERLRDEVSTDYGPVVAGEAIQADLKGAFRNRIKETGGKLSERVADLVGRDTVVPIASTLDRAGKLSTPTKGAEATTGALINPRIARIAENLRTDVYGALPVSARPLSGNPTLNVPRTPEVPQAAVNNSSLWNIPVDPSNPLPQSGALPVRRVPVVIDTLTNTPKRSAPLEPLPQRTGPNATLNLPMSRAIEQEMVANPALWNAPTAPHSPLPQRQQNIARQDIPNASLWNAQKEKGIPFSALKALRTSIGEEAASNAIMGTPEQAQFKQLYGAMSDDMRNAASLSDRARGVDPASTGSATVALNRANSYYSKAMRRSEELDGLANRSTPEGAYGAVRNSLNAGPTVYERLRGAITPAARKKVLATYIDELGTATPGQQNAEGDIWSPRSFLTGYAKAHESGGLDALFKQLPGGKKHADQLADIAKASEMVTNASKVWANPSGTGAAITTRGAIGTLGAGVLFVPKAAAATVTSLVGVNQLSKRLLLNPNFVNWMAKAPQLRPHETEKHLQRLVANSKLWGDAQFQKDIAAYADLVQQEAAGE